MASILLISNGDGIALATRFADEGHVVRIHFPNEVFNDSIRKWKNPSLLSKLPSNYEMFDLILFDTLEYPDLAEEIKLTGKVVLGAGVFNTKLSYDKEYYLKVLETLVPELHCSDAPNDAILLITSAWFNGDEFTHLNCSIEQNRLLEGDKGPLTPFNGSLLWLEESSKILREYITKLIPLLKKVEYIGAINLHLLLKEQDAFFDSFYLGFRFDTILSLSELTSKSLFNFFWNFQMKKPLPFFKDEYALAVRITTPPYPYPIYGTPNKLTFEPQDEAGLHYHKLPFDTGILGCITSRGDTIREARRRAYRTISNARKNKDIQYRSDIAKALDKQLDQLKQWGWIDA